MARSTPTRVSPTLAGAVVTPAAPNADGDIVDPGSVLVVTCGGTPTTVTVDVTRTEQGLPVGDAGGTVAANTTRAFTVPGGTLAKQPSDAVEGAGKVLVNYSSVATVTRFVLAD